MDNLTYTFEQWLKRQKNRDDPIGDLARDFIDSKTSTIEKSFMKYSPCYDALITCVKAWKEYLGVGK